MKITKSQLEKVIKEEVFAVLNETDEDDALQAKIHFQRKIEPAVRRGMKKFYKYFSRLRVGEPYPGGFDVNFTPKRPYSRSVNLGKFEEIVEHMANSIEAEFQKTGINYEHWATSGTEMQFVETK